jgi:tetratricopeptide (TPR) repeat protein
VKRAWWLAIGAVAILFGGCAKKSSVESSEAAYIAPTDDECSRYIRELESAIRKNDTTQLASLIDWDAMIARASQGVECNPQFLKGFLQGAKGELAPGKKNGFFGAIDDAIQRGGSYTGLHVHGVNGRKCVAFRLLSAPGINYHDYMLAKSAGGDVKAIDINISTSGELFSETLRHTLLLSATQQGWLAVISGKQNEFGKHAKQFEQLGAAAREGRFEEALRIEAALPESMRSLKNVMVLRVIAAERVAPDQRDAAIDGFRKKYPDDPAIDLLTLDANISQQNFKQALAGIDRIDQSVGGDPYTNVMRANVYFAAEEYDDAARCARQAIEADGRLADAYWLLVTISMQQREFQRTAELLDEIRDKLSMRFQNLRTVPEYAEFVKSEEYRQWSARQPK